MSLATISVAETNSIPTDAYTFKFTISVAETNAVPVDTVSTGGLASTNPIQVWSVQVHGAVAEALVARDNDGVLP